MSIIMIVILLLTNNNNKNNNNKKIESNSCLNFDTGLTVVGVGTANIGSWRQSNRCLIKFIGTLSILIIIFIESEFSN